jgi:hypothetical protein
MLGASWACDFLVDGACLLGALTVITFCLTHLPLLLLPQYFLRFHLDVFRSSLQSLDISIPSAFGFELFA